MDQITGTINTELETGRVVPSKSRNAISMFIQSTSDNPHQARILLDCIPRNLVTHKDKIPMPRMEKITDFVGSRSNRGNFDLTDGYHNIRIYSESENA